MSQKKILLFESKEEAIKLVPNNQIRKVQIEGKLYALANVSGSFKVFQISCPHAGADLTQGRINFMGELVCPLHAYIFNFQDGEEDRRRCPPIKCFLTQSEGNSIYVYIN